MLACNHRHTSPAAVACSRSRTSPAAVVRQRWGGTARIMHRTGPAAVVRSHRCNSTGCSNHRTSRGSSQPLPHRAIGSSSQPLRAAPAQPRYFAAAEDNSNHRTGLVAQGPPSPHQSSYGSFAAITAPVQQLKFAAFIAPVLSQKITAITARVQQPTKVCRLRRISPAADGLQPSPLRSSSSSLPPSSHRSCRRR